MNSLEGFIAGAKIVFFVSVFLLIITVIAKHTVPKDDTDSPDSRSGMILYTDYGTGCQYLKTPIFGTLTPRLGKDGKPVCGVGK